MDILASIISLFSILIGLVVAIAIAGFVMRALNPLQRESEYYQAVLKDDFKIVTTLPRWTDDQTMILLNYYDAPERLRGCLEAFREKIHRRVVIETGDVEGLQIIVVYRNEKGTPRRVEQRQAPVFAPIGLPTT